MTIKEVRNKIFCRDGNRCCKCGSTELLCMDHIMPKPQYQIHSIDNLMTLCLRCNFKKGIKVLSYEELELISVYIKEVNMIFTVDEIEEMNNILKTYFITKIKIVRTKKEKRYISPHIPVWKIFQDKIELERKQK